MDLLGKAEEIFEDNLFFADQDEARKEAEHLMLFALNDQRVGIGITVEHRDEFNLDVARGGTELPGRHVVIFARFIKRDIETDIVELIDFLAIEDHVLAGGFGIAKAITEVPAKGHAIDLAIE